MGEEAEEMTKAEYTKRHKINTETNRTNTTNTTNTKTNRLNTKTKAESMRAKSLDRNKRLKPRGEKSERELLLDYVQL